MTSTRNEIIIGTGPAPLGAALHLSDKLPSLSILTIYKKRICSGGLLNDCKQNYAYPIKSMMRPSETYA
ncbi:MAG: hypothetical protein ACYDG4_05885 [Desulfuromonadaceae bacterium]